VPVAIYLPACVNTMFGPAAGGIGVTEALVRLCERAGVRVVVPQGIESLCCSTPWTSKGYPGGREAMLWRTIGELRTLAPAAPHACVPPGRC
jgi:D-lactate dehydrogenase